MRRLWIKRRKAAAAGMAAMKVYMEDPENGDVTINGIACRKLGTLKNGRKAHFTIEEEARKVFVVAGKVSRKRNYDYAQLSEGRDDIFLSGKNILNPREGNPFIFDDTDGDTVLVKQQRKSYAVAVILTIAIVLGIGGGIAAGVMLSNRLLAPAEAAETPKVFAAEEMEITLTDRFAPVEVSGLTAGYSSGEVAVYVLRERFDAFEGFGDLSVAGYGMMVLGNNGLTDTVQLTEEGDRASFEYRFTQKETGAAYYYYCTVAKGSDAFWLVQFVVPAQDQQRYENLFPQWAQTITLGN